MCKPTCWESCKFKPIDKPFSVNVKRFLRAVEQQPQSAISCCSCCSPIMTAGFCLGRKKEIWDHNMTQVFIFKMLLMQSESERKKKRGDSTAAELLRLWPIRAVLTLLCAQLIPLIALEWLTARWQMACAALPAWPCSKRLRSLLTSSSFFPFVSQYLLYFFAQPSNIPFKNV